MHGDAGERQGDEDARELQTMGRLVRVHHLLVEGAVAEADNFQDSDLVKKNVKINIFSRRPTKSLSARDVSQKRYFIDLRCWICFSIRWPTTPPLEAKSGPEWRSLLEYCPKPAREGVTPTA